MSLVQLAAVAACGVLAGLAIFQAALISGAPLGRLAWGGQHKVLPAGLRVGSAVSIVLYAAFGYAALAKAALVPSLGSEAVTAVVTWVLAAYFTLGVLMNAISRSKSERAVMTPVALALAVFYLVLALS
ncbi:hypothetical protein [Arthrobacter sp. W4I7]|uniref:hypothetical protein n=1 Tax=Arthrobacter sp. W4I7 TaxID=3042296 RepID=UPI002783A019|nr:hypothetical protein [Arthrobacter sp. W4I7]MDQ0692926.1 hypothetical protein [Arthrobacter sp. W4I7]